MDGFYSRKLGSEDIEAIIERIRQALSLTSRGDAVRLLGLVGLDPEMKHITGRFSARFLDAVFDVCAQYGLSRMYVIRGVGPVRISGDPHLPMAETP